MSELEANAKAPATSSEAPAEEFPAEEIDQVPGGRLESDLKVQLSRPNCAYCKAPVEIGETKRACETCMSWSHLECVELHGGCPACDTRTCLGTPVEDTLGTPVEDTSKLEPPSESGSSDALGAPLATPSERPAWRGWLMTAIKLSIAGVLLSLILRNPAFEWTRIGNALLSPGTLMILGLGFVGISMSGVRWLILMRTESIHVPFWVAFRLTWIGHFWNMVIPGAVSGDAVKMYYIGQVAPERREEAWSTVFADRVIGLSALVSLAAVASLSRLGLLWSDPKLRLIVIAMVSGLVALLIGAVVVASGLGREWAWVHALGGKLPERLRDLIARVYGSLHRISRRPGTVLLAFLISFVAHGISVFNAFLLGRALGEELIPFTHYAAMFPVALFSNAVPISPGGGIGVGEMVIGLLFESSAASLGAPDPEALKAQGAMIMICHRVVFYVLAVLGGLLYVFYRQKEGASDETSAASSDSAP